jgi:tetratricopeptide (TPR) repeat protein
VTARGSSVQYKKTTKSPQQIGQELGVQYLLTGTVRWEKGTGGASRVLVSPELVQVSSGASKWQAPFDAALTDVFQVQTDIAGRVAQALDVALGDSTRRQLAETPTRNLAAWDAFLRGEAASQGMSVSDPPSLRLAITAYEQAVALDSTFVEAWAQLSRAHSVLYFTSAITPADGEAARRAAQRASTLAPHRPESHRALGDYYNYVLADPRRALTEDSSALALAPGSADLLSSMGLAEIHLGRWDAARTHLEQAARLDPRSVITARLLGYVLRYTRHYPEAQQVYDRALALAPMNLVIREQRAMVALAQGDLAGARAVLRAAPKAIDPTALVAFLANFQDLIWVLDDAQLTLLLRLGPSAFDNDRATWGMVLAQAYALHGDPARARVYADSGRLGIEEQLRTAPGDAQRHVFRGLALAYLGRKADAIREGERGVALTPISEDATNGAYFQHQLVRIFIVVGEPEKALDQLEPLLKMPYSLSPGWLKIDPNFDPLRGNPRFQRLIAGGP